MSGDWALPAVGVETNAFAPPSLLLSVIENRGSTPSSPPRTTLTLPDFHPEHFPTLRAFFSIDFSSGFCPRLDAASFFFARKKAERLSAARR
jgi:hypothetical protein